MMHFRHVVIRIVRFTACLVHLSYDAYVYGPYTQVSFTTRMSTILLEYIFQNIYIKICLDSSSWLK